jgi:hypothetical protein
MTIAPDKTVVGARTGNKFMLNLIRCERQSWDRPLFIIQYIDSMSAEGHIFIYIRSDNYEPLG